MRSTASANPAPVLIKYFVTAAAIILPAYLVWALSSLILPVLVGALLAYICRPLVARLERYRIPRGPAVGLLLLMFVFAALAGFNNLRAVIPSETGVLELRVRALYALNHLYQTLMGLDASWTRGNRFYQLAHRDVDPLLDRISELLALTPDERAQFLASRERGGETEAARSNRLLEYDRTNAQIFEMRARRTSRGEPLATAFGEPPPSPAPLSRANGRFAVFGEIFATWMIAPLIFLFLLWDTGEIKRGLLRAVPNRLFEPILAVLADVDEAVGDYLRGIFLECCALGLTVMVFFAIVGIPFRWAIAIGIFVGATNLVPYMGFAAAFVSGLGYALLAENVDPLLPLVTAETFAIWVVAAVVVAELLKSVVYEPIVLGRTVKLHPVVIVIGVAGGTILFGPAGMLLAIPTMTVAKVLVASSARHLTAYGLI